MTESANVALVRAVVSAWVRGDYGEIEWADPEIELFIGDGPSPGSWRGIAQVGEAWRSVLSTWDGFRGRVDHVEDLGENRVIVHGGFGGRGKASGLEVEQVNTTSLTVIDVRDGKVTRIAVYFDRENAPADLDRAYDL